MPAFPSAAVPDVRVHAPGRVNLIGEHTDYNGGLVLPMAINRGVDFAARLRPGRQAILRSSLSGAVAAKIWLDEEIRPQPGAWHNYLTGVLAGIQRMGWDIPGFELDVDADLPAGGGLSSSAALEAGMATVAEALCGKTMDPRDKIFLCQKAEQEFAGVPCGIMDQFAVICGQAGKAMLLDCQTLEVRDVPLDNAAVSVLVIDSGVRHHLADGEYARRRRQCESAAMRLGVLSLREVSIERWNESQKSLPELEKKRARHVVTEHQRTLQFALALEAADWRAAGEEMVGSHNSLRDDFEVSCPELDWIVTLAGNMDGVFGCRMTGGGFGGCAVALIETERAATIEREIRDQYRQATGIDPLLFVTTAAAGATVMG